MLRSRSSYLLLLVASSNWIFLIKSSGSKREQKEIFTTREKILKKELIELPARHPPDFLNYGSFSTIARNEIRGCFSQIASSPTLSPLIWFYGVQAIRYWLNTILHRSCNLVLMTIKLQPICNSTSCKTINN